MNEVILIDVDDVCFGFGLPILNAINPNITIEDVRALNHWDVFKLFNEEELERCLKLLKEYDFWENQPVYDHSIRAIEKIRKLGGEVIFITSPWEDCDKWGSIRGSLLKKHFGVDRENVIITLRKELVYGDMLIDDKLETVLKWKEKWGHLGKQAVLFETPQNHKCDYYPRIIIKDNEWKIVEFPEDENRITNVL